MLVFDVTHRPSFTAIESWLKDLRTWADENLIITLVGNKVDLTEDAEASRQVTEQEAREWAESEGMIYMETSAKTGVNVEEAFNSTARRIHEQSQHKHPTSTGTVSLLGSASGAAQRCC